MHGLANILQNEVPCAILQFRIGVIAIWQTCHNQSPSKFTVACRLVWNSNCTALPKNLRRGNETGEGLL